MPRVHKRVAAKDYPQHGIAKGDTYYYTKLKLARGGMVKRSKTPFKPSQLTNSPFKSGWLAVGESWSESGKDSDAINEAAEAIRELGSEAQDSYDNMPEGLQQGDTGQLLEARASQCEEKAGELDGLAMEWDALEEPEEPEDEEDDPDKDEYHEALQEYEDEIERIRSEVESIIEDMPEY